MIQMSELMNKLTKDSIRSQMNLIFSMMRFLSTIMDMAAENDIVRGTLSDTAEGIFNQAAVLNRDVNEYIAALPEGRVSILTHRNNKAGDENEKDIRR